MSGKRNVSVCRGHELANALYIDTIYFFAHLINLIVLIQHCSITLVFDRHFPYLFQGANEVHLPTGRKGALTNVIGVCPEHNKFLYCDCGL